MTVHTSYSLRSYNTFGIAVKAAAFAEVISLEELSTLLSDPKYMPLPKLVLGGGSNVLFNNDYEGLVIHNKIRGIEILKEDDNHTWVKSMGGEVWHEFVLWCIDHRYGGVENLSLIPGYVGAAPIQNIGAYGVEIKNTFQELGAMDLENGGTHIFSHDECRFGYRDSIFKREAKNKYLITSVTFRLDKKPKFNTSYGAIEEELKAMHVKNVSLRDVSQAVINIRRSKLPDPAEIGNAGSFFKNPEIPVAQYDLLKNDFPGLVGYKTSNEKMKLAAGWLIEQCGWKGLISGHVGMHKRQALVLVNYGGASGAELIDHAKKVQASVMERFGVWLEMEVNVVDN